MTTEQVLQLTHSTLIILKVKLLKTLLTVHDLEDTEERDTNAYM